VKTTVLLIILCANISGYAVLSTNNSSDKADETVPLNQAKDLTFGMFICWSFSTFSNVEWTRDVKDVTWFNPTGCDTDQWCRVAGGAFDDGVARGTFYLDGHKPDDDKRTYILPKDQLEVPPYQIPLRSLIARDGKNVMMAGRCFSTDQLALSSARVSTTGSMMGQAAGITAAICAKKNCCPRDLDPRKVQKIVMQRGGELAV